MRLLDKAHDLVGQLECALATLGPDLGETNVHTNLLALGCNEVEFGLGVGRESVDRDDAGQTEDALDVLDMTEQVGHTGLEGLEILGVEIGLGHTAVVLEGAGGSDHHDGARANPGHAALDVEELLGSEVRAEACLGNGNIAEAHGHPRGHDGVAAMRDVGERTAVHERRRVFERLHEIGLERVLQQSRHGALGLELAGANGLAVVGVADHDLPEALLEVGDGGRQAQDRHDLRRDGDVESILAWDALGLAADAVDDMAELTVVHVDDALPSDALDVDAERVALLDVVIQHGSEQVVGSTDGMEVAGEMKVDILHGDDLGVSTAGGTALDTEDRAERGLAQRDSALDAAATQSVGQTDGRRGLALARGRWVDGSD